LKNIVVGIYGIIRVGYGRMYWSVVVIVVIDTADASIARIVVVVIVVVIVVVVVIAAFIWDIQRFVVFVFIT
jgi:hypothetical protein